MRSSRDRSSTIVSGCRSPCMPIVRESRSADLLPSPTEHRAGLREQHRRRVTENESRRYAGKAIAALDDLVLGYFCDALRERGWEWRIGASVHRQTDFERSHDLTGHSRFVEAMLQNLADAGHLDGDAAGWQLKSDLPRGIGATELVVIRAGLPRLARRSDPRAEDRCAAGNASWRANGIRVGAISGGSAVAEQFYSDSPTSRPYNQIVADAAARNRRQLPGGEVPARSSKSAPVRAD